ncbi:DNA polymerase III [Mycoplasma phocoeninasale]|uniref:DNA polymerase III n=1 Tax=Mycoplasma phocoeninasale TaxID=2726117 RepID=A0A858U3I6_9MOLU|nr:DNA polymerase III [Mycoplasma phocoeninasale]MBN0970889.1 DNA polymerase III [Mycoplasma phocoeninasale]QJG66551.1 DNA polymerase III [Mycoplasma phocoeninasale]
MAINSDFLKTINNSVRENKLQQVYLFSQLVDEEFDEYLFAFIEAVNQDKITSFSKVNLNDLYLSVNEDNQSIAKETINDAMLWASKSNFLDANKFKILVIKNIEKGSAQSLNSLLKFLENPPAHAIVVMTTNQISKVLKTIKSRAFIINLKSDLVTIKSINDFVTVYAKKYNLTDIEKLNTMLKNLKSTILSSTSKPESLLYFLMKHFEKENANFIVIFMIFIYEDLAKIAANVNHNLLLLTEKDAKALKTPIKIDEIIQCLKDMYKTLKTNVNFPLQKSNFLIQIEKLYGK